MTLLRFALLAILAYLVWRRLSPHVGSKRRVASAPRPHPLSGGSEERFEGKLPHEILGVSRESSAEAIHDAYLRLVREHHPDLAATLSPEVQARASARTKALNWAYERLKQRR